MTGDRFVEWSVMEANARNPGRTGSDCPRGHGPMRLYNSINEAYRSQYNPGECVVEECAVCGYYEETPS